MGEPRAVHKGYTFAPRRENVPGRVPACNCRCSYTLSARLCGVLAASVALSDVTGPIENFLILALKVAKMTCMNVCAMHQIPVKMPLCAGGCLSILI